MSDEDYAGAVVSLLSDAAQLLRESREQLDFGGSELSEDIRKWLDRYFAYKMAVVQKVIDDGK